MNKKLYMLLLARGLEAGSTVEQALAFLASLPDKDAVRAESEKPEAPKVDTEAIRAEADRKAVERIAEITDSCRALGLDEEAVSEITKSSKTIDAARAAMIAAVRKNNVPITSSASVQMGADETDKFRAAAADGLLVRGQILSVGKDKLAAGFENFRGIGIGRLAQECLNRRGVNTRNLSNAQIASLVLKTRGEYAIVAGADDFVNICIDASNRSMQRGFEEGPRNWSRFCNIGSAPDFKNINRIQLFEAQDLADIDEQGNYTEAKFKDGKEVYNIDDKGLRFTISRRAIINGMIDAFTRIPRMLGASATRTIERAAYGFLTGGVATYKMSDGEFIFSVAHKNITTGAAITDVSLGADIAAMATQTGRGESGATTPCGVVPKFVHVPWELRFVTKALVADTSSAGGYNALAGELEVLSSPFLSLNDKTRRYLSADPALADVIEVSFLDGVQTPYMEEHDQTDADGRVFKVRLDVGAGVLDYRGLLTNAGK